MSTRRKSKRMARKQTAQKGVRPVLRESEAQKVFIWRVNELKNAGLDTDAARRVADTDFDLHKAIEMLRAGCSQDLLLEIAL